jgi:hypothetical protein
MPSRTAPLTTARTTLVPFALADAADLLRVFRDPDVRRWLLDDVFVSESWVLEPD